MKRFSLCEIFRYLVHFASYMASGLDRDSLEDMYKEVRSRGSVEAANFCPQCRKGSNSFSHLVDVRQT